METKVTRADGFTYITYREDKRPLKLAPYIIDSQAADAYLDTIIGYVIRAANKPHHLAKMEPAKFWALLERLATMFCKDYAPTRQHGLTKPEVRGAIYFVLLAGIQAGEWPVEFKTSSGTFVRYGRRAD